MVTAPGLVRSPNLFSGFLAVHNAPMRRTSAGRIIIVLWLLPAKAERDALGARIARLAKECDAPVFEPHLTLGLGRLKMLEGSRSRALESLVAPPLSHSHAAEGVSAGESADARDTLLASQGIRLRVAHVGFTSQFTKTLFFGLEDTEPLRALRHSFGLDTAAPFDPHLSLLYGRLPAGRQAQLARSVVAPFKSIFFDSVALIRCPDPTESRADVEAWETVASRKLL